MRAVVLDHKAVFRPGTTRPYPGIDALLSWIAQQGLSWVLLSNDPFDAGGACAAAGLPVPVLHLTRDDIPDRKARGSGLWLTTAAVRLGLRCNQLLMVGTTEWDWFTGIWAHVLYVHARWADEARKPVLALMAGHPGGVRSLLEHCLLAEPQFAFALDNDALSFRLRALLPPNVRLPATRPTSFELQDVFTRDIPVTIAGRSGRDLLMLYLLCSAYLDGTLPGGRDTWFCVYPSSTPGRVSPQLAEYLERAKVVVGAFYKGDLLQRVVQAPDTSIERWKASKGRPAADISIATQAQTVRVNPDYRGKISGKTVVVFDDFTTTGMSLDWARTLLTTAGAAQVIVLTVGKYPKPHTYYTPNPDVSIDPFTTNPLTFADFTTTTVDPGTGPGPEVALRRSFELIVASPAAEAAAPASGSAVPAASAAATAPTGPNPAQISRPAVQGRTYPQPPYTAREHHLSEQLKRLQAQGRLTWVWSGEFDIPWDADPGPTWWISASGHTEAWYDIEAAERVVAAVSAAAGIAWTPVAPAGRTGSSAFGQPAPLGGRMWPRPPYTTPRERHLGEQLDRLQLQRRLTWIWTGANVFVGRQSGDSGLWWIAGLGHPDQHHEIEAAEQIVTAVSAAAGIAWQPASPAGANQPAPPLAAGPVNAPVRPAPQGRMLPMPPYRMARQRHLGEQLDLLQQLGHLTWRGSFVIPHGRTSTTALWWITFPGRPEQWHETREAELVVAGVCAAASIIWEPVASPGGENQRAEALQKMAARRAAQS